LLIWNASASVAIGLYWVQAQRPSPGSLAVIRFPEQLRELAEARGYLPASALLIKRVAARTGDVVCRVGPRVDINGRLAAIAKTYDTSGRLMPRWRGCIHMDGDDFFVLSAQPHSFDSRYFGPIDRGGVLGTAYPILTKTRRG
jgi:conjugative transfer signal peptidase TraF